MLGLDGSFVFLEHVFWVISLNTLFILMFAYCPYHLGSGLFKSFQIGSKVSQSHIDGIVYTITGRLSRKSTQLTLCFRLYFIWFRIFTFSSRIIFNEHGKTQSIGKNMLHVHKGKLSSKLIFYQNVSTQFLDFW